MEYLLDTTDPPHVDVIGWILGLSQVMKGQTIDAPSLPSKFVVEKDVPTSYMPPTKPAREIKDEIGGGTTIEKDVSQTVRPLKKAF